MKERVRLVQQAKVSKEEKCNLESGMLKVRLDCRAEKDVLARSVTQQSKRGIAINVVSMSDHDNRDGEVLLLLLRCIIYIITLA